MDMDVLLVRRDGLTWAIQRDEVLGLAQRNHGAEVLLRTGTLSVEAVLGVHKELSVRGAGPTVRRLLPPACLGLAVVAGEPVAVLDSALIHTVLPTGEGA